MGVWPWSYRAWCPTSAIFVHKMMFIYKYSSFHATGPKHALFLRERERDREEREMERERKREKKRER